MTENNQMNKDINNAENTVNNGIQQEKNARNNNFDPKGQGMDYQKCYQFAKVESTQNKNKIGSFFKSTGGLITAVSIALLVGFGIGTPQPIVHKGFEVETSRTSDFGSSWNDNRCPMH